MSDFFRANAPVSLPIRPLSKGMIRNLPSNGLPEGAVYTAKNYIVGTRGPMRRPVYRNYLGGNLFNFPPVRHAIILYKTDGTKQVVGIDRKLLYEVGQSSFTRHTWDYDTGTALNTAGTSVVRGTSTNWTGTNVDLQVGDIMALDPSAAKEELVEISGINSATTILLLNTTTTQHNSGNYAIYRAFKAVNPYILDWTVVDNKLVFADGARPLFSYDGATFGAYDAANTWKPFSVTFFKDRLWCLRILSGSNDYRQRIIWSTVTDHTSFNISTRFVDLPYSSGAGERILGMGNLLVVYLDDAIYIGRQTTIAGDTLPFSFERVDTGGIGLIAPRALCPWLDGHFFVGQDDIYFLSQSGFERIGAPVVEETIRACDAPWGIYAAADPERDRVVFGFPSQDGEQITKVWSFDYKAKAWSYDEIACSMLSGIESTSTIQWDTLDTAISQAGLAVDWDTGMGLYDSWDAIGSTTGRKFLLGQAGRIYELAGNSSSTDPGPSAVEAILETGDFDEGSPDQKKTHTRLSVKIDSVLSSDLSFLVSCSTDRGRTWTSCGTLSISSGDDEGYVTFLATGSTIRFRLVSTSSVPPYRIMEMVRRVKGRGVELHLGPSD